MRGITRKLTCCALIPSALVAVAVLSHAGGGVEAERTLSRRESASVIGGDELFDGRDCKHIDECDSSLITCAGRSLITCPSSTETVNKKAANEDNCTKIDTKLKCVEKSPTVDCAIIYECETYEDEQQIKKCRKKDPASSVVHAPTECAAETKPGGS